MEESDTFDRIVLPIGVNLINIGPGAGTQLSLELKLLFRLHNIRIQQKLNLLYVEGETVCVIIN